MNRSYVKPVIECEEFLANEYVANCYTVKTAFELGCKTGSGGMVSPKAAPVGECKYGENGTWFTFTADEGFDVSMFGSSTSFITPDYTCPATGTTTHNAVVIVNGTVQNNGVSFTFDDVLDYDETNAS